ncbi:MAG: hypothetical protein IIU28_01035, partial [Lachnospiraceae bacterium]|nr:hypothetical protein [Lachnospiraceae bacterium]
AVEPQQEPVPQQAVESQQAIPPQYVKRGKGGKGKVIAIAGAVAACVALCAVGGVYLLTRNPMRHNAVVLYNDGDISLFRGIQKDNPKENKLAEDSHTYNSISKDGKTLYFYQDVDSDGERGDLCSVKVSSIRSERSDNEKKINKIEGGVRVGLIYTLNKNRIFYLDGTELKYYDGRDVKAIDDEVDQIVNYDDDRVLYTSGDKNDMDLKTTTLERDPDKKTIDHHVSEILFYGLEHPIYKKYRDGENQETICSADSKGEAKEIAKDIKVFTATGGDREQIWYGKPKTESVSMYDYVEDDKLQEDQKEKKPEMKDFMKPVKFSKLKTNFTKPALIREVKKQIHKTKGYYVFYFIGHHDTYYAYSDTKKKFYRFNKKKFVKLEDRYRDVERRNQLRASLKANKKDTTYYELYYYTDGDSTKVNDQVLDVKADGKVALYKPFSAGSIKKVEKLSNIHFASEVEYKVKYGDNDRDSQESSDVKAKVSINGKEGKDLDVVFDQAKVEAWDKTALISEEANEKTALTVYDLKKSELQEDKELSHDGYFCSREDGKIYFLDDLGSDKKGDLCSYDGKDVETIASDISTKNTFKKIGKNKYLIISEADLILVNDGDQKDIDDDVEMAEISKDGEILYRNDDDELYSCTDEKKGRKIADDVQSFGMFEADFLMKPLTLDYNFDDENTED